MDDIFFFKLDEEVEKDKVLEEVLEEEDEEEEIHCDNCNETIVLAKNGVFILSRIIRQLTPDSKLIRLTPTEFSHSPAPFASLKASARSKLSASYPLNVEDSSLSKYDELCWCQNCFENNWKIMRDDLWECDDFEQFEDDDDSEKKNI